MLKHKLENNSLLLAQQVSVCLRLRLNRIRLACREGGLWPDTAYNLLCYKLPIYCSKEASKSRTERCICALSENL